MLTIVSEILSNQFNHPSCVVENDLNRVLFELYVTGKKIYINIEDNNMKK